MYENELIELPRLHFLRRQLLFLPLGYQLIQLLRIFLAKHEAIVLSELQGVYGLLTVRSDTLLLFFVVLYLVGKFTPTDCVQLLRLRGLLPKCRL